MSGLDSTESRASSARPLAARLVPWAVVPVPLLLVAIVALWFLDVERVFESRGLLTVLNFALVTCTSAVVALLAGRTFLATGSSGVLFLGAGMVLMGAAFTAAPLAGLRSPNVTATVHNIGMLGAGLMSLVGAWMSFRPRAPVRAPGPAIVAAYIGALAFVAGTAYLALEGVTPPFFVQGTGGTPLRQVVLIVSVGAFGAAGLILVLAQGNATTFRRWYSLGLALLGVGLIGVLLQQALGSPLNWMGRLAQYLGGVYLLVASATSATDTRRWRLPLETELQEERDQARQLREAKEKLARVLDGANDAYWEFDIAKNQASFSERWAEITGYPFAEIEQNPSTWDRLTHPVDRDRSWALLSRYVAGEVDQHVVEARLRHKDGHWVWVLVRGKAVERDVDGKPTRLAGTCTDISARKAAEEALKETKERLSLVIDASGDGFMDWDVRSGRVKFSRRGASMLGYDLDELAPNDATWKGLLHPDDAERVMAALEPHLRGDTDHYECEHRVRHKEGRWVWVLGRGRVVSRGEDGQPLRMVGTYTDISRRKEAEEALAEREGKLRAYFDSPEVGIAVTNAASDFLEVNDTFCAMMGRSREDVLRGTWRDLAHPDEIQEDSQIVRRLVAGDTDTFSRDKRYIRKDGTILWATLSVSCVRDRAGKVQFIVAILKDVGKRVAAEEALRSSETRFRALADESPVGIYETDRSGGITYLNAMGQSLLGQTLDEATGMGALPAIHPEDRERVLRTWQETVAAGKNYRSEHRLVHRDGAVVSVSVFSSPIRARDGQVTGYVGVMVDVTEQKALQRRVEVANRLAALGTLVAGLAHEINNPLAAEMAGQGVALAVARAARRQLQTGEPVDVAANVRELDGVIEALEDAQEAGQRIAKIVREMAVFARPGTGHSLVRLRDVVEQGMQRLHLPPGAARVEVEDRGAPEVMGSVGQLAQVLQNLLTNALKAGRRGGPGTVTVRLGTDESGQAPLEVIDRGVGMAPELLTKVFEPFFTTRPVGEGRGTGLGLAVCHSIVTAHRGTITVESEVGKGSTFTVKLPAAPALAPA